LINLVEQAARTALTSARGLAHDGGQGGLGGVVQCGEEPRGSHELVRRALLAGEVRLVGEPNVMYLSARKKQTTGPSFAYPGMPYHTVGLSSARCAR
jgi:hypothetical protein